MGIINVKSVYNLPGGSIVEVHKPFGDKNYGALVKLDGRYPSAGKIAHDIKRQEYIFITDGEFTIHLNGTPNRLKPGDSIMIEDGDKYWIEGKGTSVVLVQDEEGGGSVEEVDPKI